MEKEQLNIFQRILAIMAELDYIAKGEKTVNGQYRFVSHDQVTAKLHPLLVKHGVVVLSSVEELTQDGDRTHVKLLLNFRNADARDQGFNVFYHGYGIDKGDKGPGKAISYAFKYAMLKTFCLETGDDPDNDANVHHEPAKCLEFDLMIEGQITQKEKAKMKRFLENIAESTNKDIEYIKKEAIKRFPEFMTSFKSFKEK